MKSIIGLFLAFPGLVLPQALNIPWSGYAHDPQHTGISASVSQPLNRIHWSTPVDTNLPGGEIFVHYGSPMVTAANTVLLPVKLWNGTTDGFKVQAFPAGATGASPAPLYELQTDYSLPPHNWTPSYGPVLSLRNRMYYAGAGGTVYYRDQVDSATGPNGLPGATGQIAFYGDAQYLNPANTATFNNTVQISTPLMSDRYGDIFFGFTVSGPNPANLVSGIARISVTGAGSWISAQAASGGDSSIVSVALNCTPTLSNDQRTLYFAVTNGLNGYLVSVNSSTLAPIAHIALADPNTGNPAALFSDSSASPMVGPDGDVYYGVLENPCCDSHHDRGWLLHFDSALAHGKTPGSFGWDTTASVVMKNLVPSYTGKSPYLILTKYNNYADRGGDGINKVAIVDPGATMPDSFAPSVNVMKEVISVTGVTPEGTAPAVKEWCINTVAIDPFSKSAIVNSEDGTVYRWDFTSNTLTQRVHLNPPIGEAYTPTVIGPDGTIYAINDGILYALGN